MSDYPEPAYEEARSEAVRWLARMQADGIQDVDLLPDFDKDESHWTFTFRHTVTGVEVHMSTGGIKDYPGYLHPRTYWNGSSVAEPAVEDFAAEGFEVVKTLRPTGGAA